MEVAPPAPANCPRYERGGCPPETVAAPPRSATPLTESSPLDDAPSRCHCDIHLWMAIPGPQKLQERAVLPPPDDVARSHTLSFLLTLEATLQTLRLRVIGRSEVRGCPDAIFQASRTCAGRLAQLSSGQRFSEEERPPSERPTSATLAGQVLRTCAATSRRPPAVRKTRSSARRGCLHCRLGGLSFQRHLFNVSHMRLRSRHVLPELEILLSS